MRRLGTRPLKGKLLSRPGICAGLTAIILTLSTSPAIAAGGDIDNLVPTGTYSPYCKEIASGNWSAASVCQTDNRDIYYYMGSRGAYKLEQVDADKVKSTLTNQYAPTDLCIHYDSNPTFSGSSETDIIYQEGDNIPSSAAGITWCNGRVGALSFKCDQTYIRIRGAGAYNLRRSCHETGHAVGLLHGSEAYPKVDRLFAVESVGQGFVGSGVAVHRYPTPAVAHLVLSSAVPFWTFLIF